MLNIVIQPAEESNWGDIAALLETCALPLDGARKHLNSYFLAVVDGAVVGTAGLEVYGEAALLRSVAVTPSQQGQGIGQALVAGVEAQARRRGIKTLYLLTTNAAAYFAELGFSIERREAAPIGLQASAEFQGACPGTATLMSRRVAR